jgi:hypothetical protein
MKLIKKKKRKKNKQKGGGGPAGPALATAQLCCGPAARARPEPARRPAIKEQRLGFHPNRPSSRPHPPATPAAAPSCHARRRPGAGVARCQVERQRRPPTAAHAPRRHLEKSRRPPPSGLPWGSRRPPPIGSPWMQRRPPSPCSCPRSLRSMAPGSRPWGTAGQDAPRPPS